jgi:hypothetical protein
MLRAELVEQPVLGLLFKGSHPYLAGRLLDVTGSSLLAGEHVGCGCRPTHGTN